LLGKYEEEIEKIVRKIDAWTVSVAYQDKFLKRV